MHPAAALNASRHLDLDGLTLVVGLGKSGLSAVRALTALGADVAVIDSRGEPPGLTALRQEFPDLPCFLGEFAPAVFARAARLMVSPGVAVRTPVIAQAAARGVPVWGDIELFARLSAAPVAAITGTNGKSTVTTLLGLMAEHAGARVAVGGNLGTPALDLLAYPEPDLYVLEVSSFQLETTSSLDATVATVLNVSSDHLDRHGDMTAYSAAKQRVFHGGGWQIINADDPVVAAMAEPGRRVLRFTLGQPYAGEFGLCQQAGETWLCFGEEPWLAAADLKIKGSHNQANGLAALAMGHALELPRAAMLAALRSFPGLPHRTQWVGENNGVTWFNDSKGTNVGATLAAVKGLPGRLVLIAGGDGKDQDFSPLADAVRDKVRALVLIGRDAPLIAAAVAGAAATHAAPDLRQAVAVAARLARPGDSVLLSPACASFDMFKNFEERGDVFAAAVREHCSC